MKYRTMTPLNKGVNIKKLHDGAIIPTKGSYFSAGNDLYANINEPITIRPHETVKINTGLAMEIPEGFFGGIAARSGLSTKKGLAPANKFSIIDSDYRGDIIIPLHNHSTTPQTVEPNERIAQLIVIPFLNIDFIEVDELSDTSRGNNGFGSTGK